jgi:hypothetical protein
MRKGASHRALPERSRRVVGRDQAIGGGLTVVVTHRRDRLGSNARSVRLAFRVRVPGKQEGGSRPPLGHSVCPAGYSKGVRKSGRREHDGSGASRPPGVLLGASGKGAGRWGDVTPRSARACPLPPLLHRSPILGKGDPPPGNTREGRPVPMLRRTRPRISSCPAGSVRRSAFMSSAPSAGGVHVLNADCPSRTTRTRRCSRFGVHGCTRHLHPRGVAARLDGARRFAR